MILPPPRLMVMLIWPLAAGSSAKGRFPSTELEEEQEGELEEEPEASVVTTANSRALALLVFISILMSMYS